jgi:hypothetical protein
MTGTHKSPIPTDFVRYADDIETFDPKLDDYMKRIIA